MATCKDCVHVEACLESDKDLICRDYKDSSRFVELPCKVGDSIYEPKRHQITEYQIARIVFYDFGLRMELRLMKGFIFRAEIKQEDIGKVVFLTREEAEQALKGKEKKENE